MKMMLNNKYFETYPRWFFWTFVVVLLVLMGSIAAFAGKDDLPPFPLDIAENGASCKVRIEATNFTNMKTNKKWTEERYEVHVTVKYQDDSHPEWHKLLSVRDSDVEAYRDCVKWAKAVRDARQGK